MERHCPMCNGAPSVLGKLGSRIHYRCQACGWEWSIKDDGTFNVDYLEETDNDDP